MGVLTHDFSGYRVLVAGGSRGAGLTTAHAFADAGADVMVTGTMVLPSLYESDLSRFGYEQLNLSRQESVDHFVTCVREVDVLVNAAPPNLPDNLDAHEREFLLQAVRLGMLGPAYLTSRLRLRLAQSQVPGGGVVINTSATVQWQELVSEPEEATSAVVDATRRAGDAWVRLGTRINTVVEPPVSWFPRQHERRALARAGTNLLVRNRGEVHDATAEVALFLAGPAGARITGHTIQLS